MQWLQCIPSPQPNSGPFLSHSLPVLTCPLPLHLEATETLPPASTDLLLLNILERRKARDSTFPNRILCVLSTLPSLSLPPESKLQGRDCSPLPQTSKGTNLAHGGYGYAREPQAPKTAKSLSHVEVAHKTSRKTVRKPEHVIGWEGE